MTKQYVFKAGVTMAHAKAVLNKMEDMGVQCDSLIAMLDYLKQNKAPQNIVSAFLQNGSLQLKAMKETVKEYKALFDEKVTH
jgi:hypothetical protein